MIEVAHSSSSDQHRIDCTPTAQCLSMDDIDYLALCRLDGCGE